MQQEMVATLVGTRNPSAAAYRLMASIGNKIWTKCADFIITVESKTIGWAFEKHKRHTKGTHPFAKPFLLSLCFLFFPCADCRVRGLEKPQTKLRNSSHPLPHSTSQAQEEMVVMWPMTGRSPLPHTVGTHVGTYWSLTYGTYDYDAHSPEQPELLCRVSTHPGHHCPWHAGWCVG